MDQKYIPRLRVRHVDLGAENTAALLQRTGYWVTPIADKLLELWQGGVGAALGIYPADLTSLPEFQQFAGYGRDPIAGALEKGCEIFGTKIDVADAQPGDVFLIHFGEEPRHVAIIGDYPGGGLSIIHAYIMLRKVVESRVDESWQRLIAGAYRLPGVA